VMMHCGLQQRGEIRRGFVLKCIMAVSSVT
jgi:hypothetical protein